jgi:hypothetical protein
LPALGFYFSPILREIPSCPPSNEAQQEGWGLYSETLGFELGLFNKDADDERSLYHLIGHYSFRILRAGESLLECHFTLKESYF